MAKVLKTAALIVGAVALVASGVGAVGGLGIIAATTATTIGTIAGITATVLSLAATALAPKGSLGGSATKFTIDKESGIPYLMGRSASGGRVVHRQYYGAKNVYESWVVAHSLGPVKSVGPLLIDQVAVPQNGTAIGGSYNGYMWLDTQLGACPEARALAGPQGNFPGWDGTSKFSGIAADLWTMKFDTKGKVFPEGVPQRLRVLEGVYVYDPRQDDTYPGGVGRCRIGHEETYVWSENPALHAITWAFGRYQNGVLVAGGGLGVWGIDLPPFVEWANVCDLNGWKVGGTVYTTSDNKWDVLKMIAQAGAAEVMPSGALLSVTFSAPRVSIGTIRSADICGDLDIPSTASMRDRRNTIIPRIRLESQGWEVVPLDPIIAADALALDGASRPKEITYPLIQQTKQAGQVGMYDLLNAREIDGMVIPAKIYALGYRTGDCLTLDIPEADLIDRDVIVRTREIDGGTMGVTFTCRSETPGKHAFALGQSGVEPRTPDLSVPDRYPVVDSGLLQTAIATSFPIGLTITAADDGTITISDSMRRYTDGHADVTVTGASIATGLSPGTFRAIGYDDADRVGGAVVYQLFADDIDARASPVNPGRHYVGYATIPTAGSPPADGGGATPPGGNCVTEDTPVMMADGSEKPVGQIVVGDRLWTRHEASLEWGVYPVEAAQTVASDDVWEATIGGRLLHATGDHLVYTGTWVAMRDIGTAIGSGNVVKLTVTSAHTYVSNGILSHNIKQNQQLD